MPKPLPFRFYRRDTVAVARDLLGCEIAVETRGVIQRARIVETEAYRGFEDRACHGWRGETPRLRWLFGPGGHAFVYITYGMHHMLNAATEEAGLPSAVLIRAAEPVLNIDEKTNGPGLLTKALGIDRRYDGGRLRDGPVRILAGGLAADERVAVSTRVGVEYAGAESAALPWRFAIAGNAYVSRGRPTDPERAAKRIAARMASRAAGTRKGAR